YNSFRRISKRIEFGILICHLDLWCEGQSFSDYRLLSDFETKCLTCTVIIISQCPQNRGFKFAVKPCELGLCIGIEAVMVIPCQRRTDTVALGLDSAIAED